MAGDEITEPGKPRFFRDGYTLCLPEFEAIPKARIRALNMDVSIAVSTALGVLPQVQPLRDEILEQLPRFEIRWLDRLRDYAGALYFAQALFEGKSRRLASVEELADAAQRKFQLLFADAQTLACRGYVSEEALAKFGKRRGYLGVATDVMMVSCLLRSTLPRVVETFPFTEADLDEALSLGDQLVYAIGLRKDPLRERKGVAELRDRAFTLFIEAYGQVRRAVQYLRWEKDDAECLMPSLYKRRRPRRAKQEESQPAPAVEVENAASAPVDVPLPRPAAESNFDPFESPAIEGEDPLQRVARLRQVPAMRLLR